jgi:hypothetical protein
MSLWWLTYDDRHGGLYGAFIIEAASLLSADRNWPEAAGLGGDPGRDNAVVGSEHRCSQPTDAANEVALRVPAKATHPTPACQIKSDP